MAEEIKNPQTQLRIDLKTIKPTPRAVVSWGGKDYEVLSLIDVPYSRMIDILSAAQAPAAEGKSQAESSVARSRAQLKALVPSLEDDVLDAMTYGDMVRFLEAALGSAENPQ